MKTNKIKIFFSIISFCFLVTSCNNLLSELTQQKSYIQISTNLDNSNQRTVLPNFSVVLGQGYTWELYKGDTLLQTWNDANGKSAYQNMCESKIEVDPGSYSFELMVKKEGEIILKSESQTVTIEQNKKIELNFVLCPPTANEAYGSVNFILKFPNEKVNIVEAKLFMPGNDKKEPVGNMQEVEITKEDSSSIAKITVINVPAGSYLLKVDLCYQVAAYSRIETINTYTTIVQVAAGFCSEAEVTLNSLTDYYTITYKVDDVDITQFKESNVIPTTFKKNSNVTLPIAYNDGQLSIGWFNDPDCTDPVELNDDKFTITENTTLYTQWGNVVNTNDLSFDTIDATNNIEGLLIYTETGLNYFRDIVNGTLNENIIVSDDFVYRKGTPYPTVNAKLCSDIELSETEWVPIGNGKYEGTNIYYEGSFDGNGKGVTNLRITSNGSSSSTESSSFGFFGSVKNATIKNLYVSGEINITCNQNDSVGGIVGYAKDNSKIDSCVNNVIITATNSSNVGGIIGSSNNSSVSNCINVAELSGKSGAGIIGSFSNTSNEKITIDCVLNLGNLNFSNNGAGIIYIGSINVEVSNSVNTGVISGANIYPICNNYNNNIQNSNTVTNCFYYSDRIQNVPENSFGSGKTSSDLDTLSLDGWYNGENSDLQYPIPSTIQEAFENKSFCCNIIFVAAKIPEATAGYVPGAYYVNGDTGNDGNDGLSIDEPYKKLTKAITNAIASDAKTVYVSGTLTPSNQEITSPSSGEHEQYSVFYIQDNAFDDVVKIIGVSENTNFSGNNQTRIFSTLNACNFKMKNINFINGNTTGSGAAIYFWQGSLELDSCKISGNSSTLSNAYNGIYNYGGSVLKMTNTTCENSVYLSKTTATIGNDCTIGTSDTTATDGFITLDESTLILDGEDIVIYKPIYINNLNARIELGNDFEKTDSKIQIKINPVLVNGFALFEEPPENLLDLFELVDSEGFTLGADGQIIKN